MAVYGIALGGNKRNWPGWDNLYSSGNTRDNIGYAAHLKTRHIPLPFDFDGSRGDWQSWVGQTATNGALAVGDVLQTHWINPGSDVRAIYVHVKKPAATGTAVKVGVKLATGALVVPAVTVNLTVAGYVKIPISTLMQTKGAVEVEITDGDFMSACVEVFVDLFDAHGVHGCGCYIAPCDVPTPEPECFSPGPSCG